MDVRACVYVLFLCVSNGTNDIHLNVPRPTSNPASNISSVGERATDRTSKRMNDARRANQSQMIYNNMCK